jgi:hypothetical protein
MPNLALIRQVFLRVQGKDMTTGMLPGRRLRPAPFRIYSVMVRGNLLT